MSLLLCIQMFPETSGGGTQTERKWHSCQEVCFLHTSSLVSIKKTFAKENVANAAKVAIDAFLLAQQLKKKKKGEFFFSPSSVIHLHWYDRSLVSAWQAAGYLLQQRANLAGRGPATSWSWLSQPGSSCLSSPCALGKWNSDSQK